MHNMQCLLRAALSRRVQRHSICAGWLAGWLNSLVLQPWFSQRPPVAQRLPLSLSVTVLFCLVVAVSDGDTLTARCGRPGAYQQMKVRVAAIDAPELGQAHGRASRQQLLQLCIGQRARIDPVERDRYGRTVAHVRCNDIDVASEQVRTGLAWVYARYAGSRPQLAPLERRARASGAGLWAQRRPMAPWTYRHRYPQHPLR